MPRGFTANSWISKSELPVWSLERARPSSNNPLNLGKATKLYWCWVRTPVWSLNLERSKHKQAVWFTIQMKCLSASTSKAGWDHQVRGRITKAYERACFNLFRVCSSTPGRRQTPSTSKIVTRTAQDLDHRSRSPNTRLGLRISLGKLLTRDRTNPLAVILSLNMIYIYTSLS